jgi:hypothetical protein
MGALFGSKKPPAPEPVRMPDPEDPEAEAAARRAAALYAANRGGRASTLLSSDSKLGSSG